MEKLKRRLTSRGLGASAPESRLQPGQPVATVPPTSGIRDRATTSSVPPSEPTSAPLSRDVPIERAEKVSTRRAPTSRSAVRVDDVGHVAVAIAIKAAGRIAPKLLKSRSELTQAPIDPRDAFVISLIDGKMGIAAIVDISGMRSSEVVAILERLARLGIVSLP